MTVSLQELFDAGVHLGHQAQKWHPKMKPWIYCEQNGIHLFDLEKTAAQLQRATDRLAELKKAGKSVIVVATKKQAAEIVPALAEQAQVMYIVNRWPGGLITNWEQIRKSIKRMGEIEVGLQGDKYREYTKYERLLLEKELSRLRRLFGGVKDLKNKPDALFVVDVMKEKNAVHEALKENVEIIALIDSNTDPTGIAIPVPGNDDALSSIKLIIAAVLGVQTETNSQENLAKKTLVADVQPSDSASAPTVPTEEVAAVTAKVAEPLPALEKKKAAVEKTPAVKRVKKATSKAKTPVKKAKKKEV
jgi:small subunit ribosomal protein S2